MPVTARVLLGIVAALVFLGLCGAGLFLILHKSTKIDVPMPPGYQDASQAEKNSMESGIKSESKDSVLDCFYTAPDAASLVVAFHTDSGIFAEKPPSDPEKMREYYDEHKDEITGEFSGRMVKAGELSVGASLEGYKVVTLACGDSGLDITMTLNVSRNSVYMELLIIFKGNAGFAVMYEAADDSGAEETMQFLKDNITFK